MTVQLEDFSKLNQTEITTIKKNYDYLISCALKNPCFDSLDLLFSTHPFYKNLIYEENGNHIVGKFDFFSLNSKIWISCVAAVHGKEKTEELYVNISNKIKLMIDKKQ